MRVIVFFDLPTISDIDKRNYRKFRKFLIKSGFLMMQESVYSKLALNTTQVIKVTSEIKKNCPSEGNVQILTVTEKQFNKIEIICGEKNSEIIDSDERLIIL